MKDRQAISHQANHGRRDFLRGSGAVVSAMLAPAAAGIAHAGAGTDPSLQERLGMLEDAAAIRRLYAGYAARLTGASEPVPAHPGTGGAPLRLMQDTAREGASITVAPDRLSATAQFPCMAQIAIPLTGSGSLLDMARLQGQHSEIWWESGIHELDCVRTGGGWEIRGVTYRKTGAPPIRGIDG